MASHYPPSALVVVLVSLLGYVLRLIAPTSGHRREGNGCREIPHHSPTGPGAQSCGLSSWDACRHSWAMVRSVVPRCQPSEAHLGGTCWTTCSWCTLSWNSCCSRGNFRSCSREASESIQIRIGSAENRTWDLKNHIPSPWPLSCGPDVVNNTFRYCW